MSLRTLLLVGLALTATPRISVSAEPPLPLPTMEVTGRMVADPEWIAYRKAASAIRRLQAYEGEKHLIRPLYQLSPRNPEGFSYDGLKFAVEDDASLVPLPHTLGWADVPLDPGVDQSKARFVANRPKGSLTLGYVLGLVGRQDQTYDQEWLRAGCAQSFAFYRSQSIVHRLRTQGKQCVGVSFWIADADTTLIARDAEGNESSVPLHRSRFAWDAVVRFSPETQTIMVRPLGRSHVIRMLAE